MIAFIFILFFANCLAVPLRQWAELDFIIPISPAGEETGGICESGLKQSPIDINTCTDEDEKPLNFRGHCDKRTNGFTLKNTGFSAQISYKSPVPTLYGGPLLGGYKLAQLHFHWGTDNKKGSEHSIGGNFSALEAHFVHYKKSYGSLGDAANKPDGLAVVGILFELSLKDNRDLGPIISGLTKVHDEYAKTSLKSTAMNWFHKYCTKYGYYTYPGSLTTSPCAESVRWIVLKKKSRISAKQLAEFRKLEGPDGAILENRRSVQPTNDRTISCGKHH